MSGWFNGGVRFIKHQPSKLEKSRNVMYLKMIVTVALAAGLLAGCASEKAE
jgi:hypothetical protein